MKRTIRIGMLAEATGISMANNRAKNEYDIQERIG
jgi:hypothetical protein